MASAVFCYDNATVADTYANGFAALNLGALGWETVGFGSLSALPGKIEAVAGDGIKHLFILDHGYLNKAEPTGEGNFKHVLMEVGSTRFHVGNFSHYAAYFEKIGKSVAADGVVRFGHCTLGQDGPLMEKLAAALGRTVKARTETNIGDPLLNMMKQAFDGGRWRVVTADGKHSWADL